MPRSGAFFVALALMAACASFDDAAPDANGGTDASDGGLDDAIGNDATASDAISEDAGAIDAGPSAAYRAAVLADGPIAYWRMGAVKDLILVPDETDGGNDLLLSGSPDFTTGAPGVFADDPSVSFGGVSGYATATASSPLAFNDGAAFTLECWARRAVSADAAADSFFQHLISFVDGTTTPAPSTQNGYLLYTRRDSPAETFAAQGALDGGPVQTGGTLVTPGIWAHYAMVFDGAKLFLYIDAQLQSSVAVQGVMKARVTPFTLAKASNETARYFHGSLDEVAVYGRALTVQVIANHVAIAMSNK